MKDDNPTGPTIMVDDDDTDAYIAETCYRRAGLTNPFVRLSSGSALLEHLDGVLAGREPMPRVVLLDINMPGLDGFSTLQRVRDVPEFADVPVIAMLTNSDDPKEIERAKELGADEFISKPPDQRAYVALFRRLVLGDE